MGQGQQSCQKWKKSKKVVQKLSREQESAAGGGAGGGADGGVRTGTKHKVTPGKKIPGWLNEDYDD